MKENMELERSDIAISREMEVDCDIGQEITVYIETWFDTDKKFGTHTDGDEGSWLNMYGKYDPFADTLRIECEVYREDGSTYFDYEPTEREAKLIKEMIAEKVMQEHRQTPREPLDKSARADGEGFCVRKRSGKGGNTWCISPFSRRISGGKDPASATDDLFRGSQGNSVRKPMTQTALPMNSPTAAPQER